MKLINLSFATITSLQQLGRYVRQFAALSLLQEYVFEKLLSGHLFTEMSKTVGPLVQIRLVNLEDVARKHHLGPFTCPRDDRLDFMRRQVLCLVNDEIRLAQAPSSFRRLSMCWYSRLLGLYNALITLRLSISGCRKGLILLFWSPGRKPIS